MPPRLSFLTLLLTVPLLSSCVRAPAAPALAAPAETIVSEIRLAGAAAEDYAEYSGMAWYGDWLVLLPQYPQRYDDHLPALARDALLDYLSAAASEPLVVTEIPIDTGGLERTVAGFEGFEAIAFAGDRFYLTVEANPRNGMMGYLVMGAVTGSEAEASLRFVVDPATLTPLPPQTAITNLSDEAIVLTGDGLLTIYEANGAALNERPVARSFAPGLAPGEAPAMPSVEFRLTDATPADAAGRFWAINYQFAGDRKLFTEIDPIATQWGKGPSHAANRTVERLLQFQIGDDGAITLVEQPPLQLKIIGDASPRNWEGIARLASPEHAGFLLVTDKFPRTILAFVACAGHAGCP